MWKYILLIPNLVINSLASSLLSSPEANREPFPTPTHAEVQKQISTLESHTDITYEGIVYRINDFTVHKPAFLQLIANHTKKQRSENLKNENNCQLVTSGGFYAKNYQPLGLLKIDGEIRNKKLQSTLFNGFLAFDGERAEISTEMKSDYPNQLQSGPIVFKDGQAVSLTLSRDQGDRRVIAATDQSGKLHVLALSVKSVDLIGPLLADVPNILTLYNHNLDIKLVNALNLDGGGAAAYVSQNTALVESETVGTFLCYKNEE